MPISVPCFAARGDCCPLCGRGQGAVVASLCLCAPQAAAAGFHRFRAIEAGAGGHFACHLVVRLQDGVEDAFGVGCVEAVKWDRVC